MFLNLAFTLVCVAGLLAWYTLPKEEFPQVATDSILVTVLVPGANPSDVEDLVLRPLEEAIDGVSDVDHVYAEAQEGVAIVRLELLSGADAEATRLDVEKEINATATLPEGAERPQVSVAKLRIPLLHIGLTGDRRAVPLAETIAEELAAQPSVDEVDLYGDNPRHLAVTLDPAKAQALGLSPSDVAAALSAAGVGAPAGEMRPGRDAFEGAREGVLVRTEKGLSSVQDVLNVPLLVAGGTHLRVGDVATADYAYEDNEVVRRCNGQPCIDLAVCGSKNADALEAVPRLQAWAEARKERLPPGMSLVSFDDSARLVADRLKTLAGNGGVGIVLVGLLLAVFIGRRNTLLVVWGMPVAYLGAVMMMQWVGMTVNVISTFGLLVVTGIIVDDAVVIVENVQRHLEMGKDRVQASLDGTLEVAPAVLAATLTTCLAFAPLLMLDGAVGRVMRNIPMVVILSLVASLFEAFFVLPGHLAHHAAEQEGVRENAPTRWLKGIYAPILDWVTTGRQRYVALAGVCLALLATLSLATQMKLSLTTKGQPVFALINVDLPPGSDLTRTEAVLRRLEKQVVADAGPLILWFRSHAGRQSAPQGFPVLGRRYGQLKVGFHKDPDVLDRAEDYLEVLRERLASDPSIAAFEIATLTGGPPAGKPVDLRVRGRDADVVAELASDLAAHLRSRDGVSDVRLGLQEGTNAFEVRVRPSDAARYNLREATVARAVRAALNGAVALDLNLDERSTEVRVTLPNAADRDSLADLPIALPGGGQVRLRQVADVSRVVSLERVERVDGQRAVRLTAQVDTFVTSATDEQASLEAAYAALPDAEKATLFYGGELADTAKSFGQLPNAMLLAIGMIYTVLAIQFRSYLQPLIILAAVPLGMAGVVLGLFVFGMDLSLIASIGAVGLAGIVVNDSLVLVDFVNQERARGTPLNEAVVQASLTRLRPILVTTVTTVCGLLPLAIGLAGAEPLLAPMAVAISFGLSFATGLMLIAVPVLYLVVEDFRGGEAA